MTKNTKGLLSATVLFMLTGCASYNVNFSDEIQARIEYPVGNEEPDVLRLYIDGVGDLYPRTVRQVISPAFKSAHMRDATLYSALRNGNVQCGAEDEEQMLCEVRSRRTI